jgi:hypothetical protein
MNNIFGRLFGAKPRQSYSTPDDKRPVKFVRESRNVWRVVYAD